MAKKPVTLKQIIKEMKIEHAKIDPTFISAKLMIDKVVYPQEAFITGYLYALDRVEVMLEHYRINPRLVFKR